MDHLSDHPGFTVRGGFAPLQSGPQCAGLNFSLQTASLFLFPLFPGSSMEPPKAPVLLLPFIHFSFLNLMQPQQHPKTRSTPSYPAITPLGIYLKT